MQQLQDTRAEVEDMNLTKDILANLNTGMMYTDQIGTFPVRSYNNMKFIFVAYIYDIDTILAVPLKTKILGSMVGAFKKALKILDKHNCKPR